MTDFTSLRRLRYGPCLESISRLLIAALAVVSILCGSILRTSPLAAQTSEDLPDSGLSGRIATQDLDNSGAAGQIAAQDLDDDRSFEMEDLLWQADQLAGADQAAAADLYSRVIDLAAPGGRVPAPGAVRQMLLKAYLGRAAAQLKRRQTTAAEEDLARILQIDPNIELSGGAESAQAIDLFNRLRQQSLARLDLIIDPSDALVLIDGRPLTDPERPHYLRAGEHELRLSRPGYGGEQRTVELTAGKRSNQKFALQRTSAAIRFAVRPAGAWVDLDDRRLPVAGPNVRCTLPGAGPGEMLPADASAGEGSSMDCLIGGLSPGRHQIRVGSEGWRHRELQFEVVDLSDLRYPDIQLERTTAAIVLSAVPADSRITLDGETVTTAIDASGSLRLPTTPGSHELVVNTGGDGLFRSSILLTDRQELQVMVDPLPSLSLAGVLGPDRVAATDLAVELAGKVETLADWVFLDRSRTGAEVTQRAGLEAGVLRALADSPDSAAEPDWKRIQSHLDREFPASLHLLAILADQSYASYADLWLMAAAPGPPRPVRTRIDLGGETRAAALLSVLTPPLTFTRRHLGADFIDLPGVTGATAFQVTPGGPADAAGLRPGQSVTRFDGETVSQVADLRTLLGRTAASDRLPIQVRSGAIELTVEIVPESGPVLLSPSSTRQLYPALWARLDWAARRRPVEPWLLDLDRAALHLAAGDWGRAAELLRLHTAPERPGVGSGTAQYWLGMALEAGGDPADRPAAVAAYAAAATTPLARLVDDGGPPVAPRARIRLQALQQAGR